MKGNFESIIPDNKIKEAYEEIKLMYESQSRVRSFNSSYDYFRAGVNYAIQMLTSEAHNYKNNVNSNE